MSEEKSENIDVTDFMSEADVQDVPEEFDKDRLNDELDQLYNEQ